MAQRAPVDLTYATLEELMDLRVTSVARKSQRAEDVPAALYVITRDDIRQSGLMTLPEILRLARQGMAVLFISAELEELTRLSDRIAVLRDRRKVGELPGGSESRQVLEMIAGAA